MRIGLLNIRPRIEDTEPFILPNGCDYLAAYVNHHLPGSEAFVEYKVKALLDKKPDIIGLSSFSRTYSYAREIAKEIKEHSDVPVIIGGHHISALPENLDQNMDIGVIGEGENTLVDLISLHQNGNFNPDKLAYVPGIIFRNENGGFTRTASRPLINDLDILPLPYRTMPEGVSNNWQQSIFTSRGCPFRCKYCAISEFWDKIRYHSPERVINELNDLIARYNCKTVIIHDDLFGINKKRLKILVDSIRSEKIHQKVNFVCNARASVFDDEICQMFVDMNIKSCVFGMESANDRILAYMKGSTTARQNQQALDLCKKYNILGVPNFIVGFPTETQEEAADTYWFIKRNMTNLTDFRVFSACPLPGTHLWDYAVSKQIIKNFEDWEHLDLVFTADKSIYLNADIYDQYEYEKVLDQFYNLQKKLKPFTIHSGELQSKNNYSNHLFKFISNSTRINQEKINILEISGLNYSIADKISFEGEVAALKVESGKLNTEALAEKSFEVILLLHGLELLRNPASELAKLKKLLTPGGMVIIASYNTTHPIFLLKLLMGTDLYYSSGWNENDLNFFKKAGKIIDLSHENSVEALRNLCGDNIYNTWGPTEKQTLSHFTREKIEKLAGETSYSFASNRTLAIELDKNVKNTYELIQKVLTQHLGPGREMSEVFCNVSILVNEP
jgi:anaerobic magnesium-protoporphyrin IX monomethyl ester cyclase